MISLGAKLVKAALRLYTYPYRKRHASLSRSVRSKSRPYRPPEGFVWERTTADGVRVEILSPPDARTDGAILHFHGGGHTVGMNGMYRRVAERYARGTGCPVYSIDYETGENLAHPALLEDCFRAVGGLRKSRTMPEKWVAVGDSMGANVMLAVCLRLRDGGGRLPAALVCISPFVDLAASGDSYRRNAYADPLYSLPKNQSFAENEKYLRRRTPYIGDADPKDPYLSPAYADFTGFPPLLVQYGGCETSASDGEMLAARARDAGTEVLLREYAGMFHDFQYLAPFLHESKRAWREIFAFIEGAWREE